MADRIQHQIRLDGTADTFPCRGDETVVAAMERAAWSGFGRDGGRIPVGCRRGGCGVCRVQVLDGAYRVTAMNRAHVTEEEERAGYALACCLLPRGDLSLRPALKPAAATARLPTNTTKASSTTTNTTTR